MPTCSGVNSYYRPLVAGGADHPDNYLFALGSSFNRSIGDKYDDLNCFLAGLVKTQKAVEVSIKHGSYNPFKHNISSSDPADVAKHLYGKGQALMSHVRKARRAEQQK